MHVLNHLPETPDAANMLRTHVARRVHEALAASRQARLGAGSVADWESIRDQWRARYREAFPTELFAMRGQPLRSRTRARHERERYVIETILFESLWGCEVNAHICLPRTPAPWPAIILPTGHSPKTGPAYQVPPVICALNGFAAITFDAPGQGERRKGSDHFSQGVACILTGLWIETFFAADALRAIDYLESRSDIDMSMGVGMAGVSGGGETTMTCAALDQHITCIAPVCCTGAQRVLGAEDFYSSCPETLGPGVFAAGIDMPEKLAIAAPIPCLAVSGELDEVYHQAMIRRLVEEVRPTYALYGCPDRFEHFEQKGVGHCFSAVMAERVVAWMRRWMLNDSTPVIGLDDPESVMEAPEVINCGPNPDRNMQAINEERADDLAVHRAPSEPEALRRLLAIGNAKPLSVREAPSEMSWWHRAERIALQTEDDLWAPLLCVINTRRPGRNSVVLWVDDRGKWPALERERWLLDVTGFLNEESTRPHPHICVMDARGWGETAPEQLAYDFVGWNDITRILSYLSNTLDRPLIGGRVKDVLAALAYLRTREDIDPARIILGGRGVGALVALFAAALDDKVAAFIGEDMLTSYYALVGPDEFSWPHDIFVPRLLEVCDVPDVIHALSCPTLIVNPLDAHQRPSAEVDLPPPIAVRTQLPPDRAAQEIWEWINDLLRE